jgi:ABC-type transport system involved in multi-copper enzyme maturation permease subunit
MYFWKCWRESRIQFVVGAVVLVALCSFLTVAVARFGGPNSMRGGVHPPVAQAWSTAVEIVLGGWASFLSLVWGLVLGSTGLGKEFDDLTVDFLFTRPRRRRHWVWVGWQVGVADLSVMAFAAVGTTCGILAYLTGHVHTWRPFAAILPLAIGGTVAYGLSYFTTVVTRSGRQGLSYGIGILLIALLLPRAISYYWEIRMPSVLDFMMTACKWAAGTAKDFPFGGLVFWIVVALLFPVAAQAALERVEV